nr:hypothetical protein GCM10020093_018660 [Planobispora longispora]
MVSWYSHTDRNNAIDPQGQATPEWRIDYLITEETQPAPLGSSLGWLIQIDGDERRNEFLNAAWAKAVLPVRPGHEIAALKWLVEVEGQAAFDLPYPFQPGDPPEYQGKKVGEVLQLLAAGLQASNTSVANLLATEEVFETGFDPLDGASARPSRTRSSTSGSRCSRPTRSWPCRSATTRRPASSSDPGRTPAAGPDRCAVVRGRGRGPGQSGQAARASRSSVRFRADWPRSNSDCGSTPAGPCHRR